MKPTTTIYRTGLYDSETNRPLTCRDLSISPAQYNTAVRESLATPEPEGHIRVNGRRVYAA